MPTRRYITILPLLIFIGWSIHLIITTPFPAPDELEHLSYAAHLQETGRFLPLFKEQTTLDRNDFTKWDTRPNYIGHPSPYYLYIAAVFIRTLPPAQAILTPRFASFLLLLLAASLSLNAGLRWFRTHTAALAVFLIATALCPEIFSAARQVTNDSLAILGGALVYWGLAPAPNRRWLPGIATTIGFALTLWAKPNAGIGVGAFLGLLFLLNYPNRNRILIAAILGGIIGILPTIPIILTYGAIVPVTAEAIWDVHHADSIAQYLPIFLFNLGYTWAYSHTGIWPIEHPADIVLCLVFWTTFATIACSPWLTRQPTPTPTPATIMARAAITAVLFLMLVHFTFAATRLGASIPAASFRYYLPLLPALAHAAAHAMLTATTPNRRKAITTIFAAAMAAGYLL